MKSVNFFPYWRKFIKFLADKNADWKPKAAMLFALLYLIWPIDLIPDLAPILGWLDDIGITAFAAGYLMYAVNHYLPQTQDSRRKTQDEVQEAELLDDNRNTKSEIRNSDREV